MNCTAWVSRVCNRNHFNSPTGLALVNNSDMPKQLVRRVLYTKHSHCARGSILPQITSDCRDTVRSSILVSAATLSDRRPALVKYRATQGGRVSWVQLYIVGVES